MSDGGKTRNFFTRLSNGLSLAALQPLCVEGTVSAAVSAIVARFGEAILWPAHDALGCGGLRVWTLEEP